MRSSLSFPFPSLAESVLADVCDGRCVSVYGLSNGGKSTLLRALATPQGEQAYTAATGRTAAFVYVDCNRAVAISAQAFYEVVLRSLLERLGTTLDGQLSETVRQHYQALTSADSSFTASLSFNLALTELCHRLGSDLALLLDEVDEIFGALESRALLNLRALRDLYQHHLVYVTATLRPLPELHGQDVEGEFSEMFDRSTYPMPLLNDQEATHLLDGLGLPRLTPARRRALQRMAGGHPGLLVALAQAVSSLPESVGTESLSRTSLEPQPRAECLKLWSQLTGEERACLMTLTVDAESRLRPQDLRHLEALNILRDGRFFSPTFAEFVAARSKAGASDLQGVHLDPDSGDVWVDGIRIPVLTDLEFRLLKLLHSRRDRLTDKFRIVTEVWGEGYLEEVDDARIEKLVSRLRGKIESDPASPLYLVTQRGRGYKLLSRPRAGTCPTPPPPG
ncbi:MAG TPA: winged helix-turn-helix domain-containing protein [Anaerolineales bacterium]|nr:winged helix-turn-helix domain-containing protein [Anaerolineales bacterium]